MPQYHSLRFPLGKEGGFSQRNHRVAACKPFRSGILLAVLCWLAFCAGTVSLWADTCSYTYSCSGPQCGMTMGGMSGTRSQSGVTFAQCEAARQMAPHSTTCVCTSDGAGASGTAIPVATGNLTQDLVSAGANAMIMNIKNPYVSVFMQHATNSFLVSLFSNSQGNADQQRQMMEQRQIMEQQLLEHQRELERQRRIAEQQRLDAMFARLNRKLKLEGMPFNLTLKAMNTETDLELKSMNSGGPDGLKLKISNANPTSYGLKGLPGIYVGGPAGSAAGDPATASSANPNLVAGPGSGTTGPGIPGLPGIYLDGVQPSQAPQLAQAAEKMSGPEREVAEDAALQAAQKNPAEMNASQDPQVQTFQQTVHDYDEAAAQVKQAQQQLNNEKASVDADHAVLDMAHSKLQSGTATEAQQQAYSQMVQAAKTDEDAAAAGQRIFDNANATLAISRTKAATALSALATPSGTVNDASVVDLSHATHLQPTLLRASSAPAAAPIPALAPAPASAAAPTVNPPQAHLPQPSLPQLCTQLTQAQDALRRLIRTQETQSQNREQWEKEIDDDADDALQRGLDMVRDYGGKKLTKHLEELIKGQDKEIEALYLEISSKKGSEVGELQKKFEQMDLYKARLQDALKRAEADQHHLDQLAHERDFLDWSHKQPDDLKGAMEGVHQLADILLDEPAVKHALQLSPESVTFIKSVGSLMDSGYDIYADYLGAQQIKQLNQNSEQYLEAVKALNGRIHTTVAQLETYRSKTPEGLSCTSR